MFTEEEQEEIINEFVNVIKMKTYINEKVSICRKCKFTEENLNLYHLPIPESAIKTICKFNYNECETCTTLKTLKSHVYGCSMKKFENTIEAIEDKHVYKIQEHGESAREQGNTNIYYYVNLNPFPTYKKVVNHILNGDTGDYNQKIHTEIRNCYNSLWNGSFGIETYFTKLRNKAITEYDKTFKKRSDTTQRFCDYINSHIEPISNIIKKICDYIENRQEHNSIEHIMYSNNTSSVVKQMMSRVEYNDGYTWEKFLDARFPYKPKAQWLKTQTSIPKISQDYLKTNDFD